MQTIGERLEEARKKRGISLRDAAEATKIRGDYLQKFESNQFDIGLTDIYTRGFLRTYCNHLKLPTDRILADFAALGHGEAKPRTPSREVYGRMEVAAAPAEGEVAKGPVTEPPASGRSPTRSRTGSSLPKGLDPALVFKGLKIGGLVVVALLVVLILKAVFSGNGSPATNSGTAGARAVGPSIGLVALRPVTVTVKVMNADDTKGAVLFSGTVVPGETKIVQRPGAVFIETNAAENLMLEINGTQKNLGEMLGTGRREGKLPAPQP